MEGFICVKTGYRPTAFDLNNINNGKLLLLLYRITGKEKYWKAAILLRDQLRTHPRTYTKAGSKVTVTNEKWQLITTHTARKSFATNQYLSGAPILTIMAITGHKTEKSFLRYIKISPSEHAKILKIHWGKTKEMKIV